MGLCVFTSMSSRSGGRVERGQQDAEKEKQAELPHNDSTELPASRSETLNFNCQKSEEKGERESGQCWKGRGGFKGL
jgi:hypothetical protein